MLFIDNKYTKWYNSIISNAQARTKPVGYTEKHHIIPKSLGGSNSNCNLVVLTAREHFICHFLLTKMIAPPLHSKMVFAFCAMRMRTKRGPRYMNSRLYQSLRKQFSILCSERTKNNNPMSNPLTKEKHSQSITKRGATLGTTGLNHSAETKLLMSQKAKNKIVLQTTKDKLRDINLAAWEEKRKNGTDKRKPLSEETKRKISESVKRRNQIKQSNCDPKNSF